LFKCLVFRFRVIYEAVILDVGFEGEKEKEKEKDDKTYPVICFFTTLSCLSLGKEKNHWYKSSIFLVLFCSSKVNFQDNSFVAFETKLAPRHADDNTRPIRPPDSCN